MAAATDDIRTAKHAKVPPQEALKCLVEGNQRFMVGNVQQRREGEGLRNALATDGQNPHTAVVGCADSRCPIEILFDAQPGDLFVLRNAGNTCTHAEGSIVGSLEYSTGHLKTGLILVLGHTKCGAIAGATKTMLAKEASKDASGQKDKVGQQATALEVLLDGLTPVAQQALTQLPKDSTADDIAAHAVKVNVFNTMDRILEFSEAIRKRVAAREVQVHGAIYDLSTGRVDFLGQSPKTGELADSTAPPPAVSKRYGVQEEEQPEVQEQPEGQEQPKADQAPAPREEAAGKGEPLNPPVAKNRRWYHHLGFGSK